MTNPANPNSGSALHSSPVLVERHGETALITLNRPNQRNAIDLGLRAALSQTIYEVRDDASIRSVVITGAGRAFCGGGDLRSLREANLSAGSARERMRRMHFWFDDWVNLEKPVIAAVNGAAFGSGLSLALAADFILCSPAARFSAVFARIGVAPDLGAMMMLPRLVGLQRAKEIMFSAREIGPEEAFDLGLVYAIRPAESLVEDALRLAACLNSGSAEAFAVTKSVLNQSLHLDHRVLSELEASAQAVTFTSDYFKEASERFLSKQSLRFGWKLDFGRHIGGERADRSK
jgi:2-(1,2-epoxy-1,2-dihydrophenyl)acetyl-CoA isomerase